VGERTALTAPFEALKHLVAVRSERQPDEPAPLRHSATRRELLALLVQKYLIVLAFLVQKYLIVVRSESQPHAPAPLRHSLWHAAPQVSVFVLWY